MRARWLVVAVVGLLASGEALAARPRWRRFEPTDLGLQPPGSVQVDMQVGAVGGNETKLVLPDAEIDIGLTSRLELDIDGALSARGPGTAQATWEADPLWPALKLGLGDVDAGAPVGVAVQVGPRLPIDPKQHGVGGEALVLVGAHRGDSNVVLNLGAFADPRPTGMAHPYAATIGLDAQLALSPAWRLLGEVGHVRAIAHTTSSTSFTLGLGRAWPGGSVVSLVALASPGQNGDGYGLLVGWTPVVRVF